MTDYRRVDGHSHSETTLIWWIDEFRRNPGEYYRWSVRGRLDETAYPEWEPGPLGWAFAWRVPNLRGGGGRYVFALREVSR